MFVRHSSLHAPTFVSKLDWRNCRLSG